MIKKFIKDESGATAIEYGLIAGLISVVCITVWTSIGSNLNREVHEDQYGLDDRPCRVLSEIGGCPPGSRRPPRRASTSPAIRVGVD